MNKIPEGLYPLDRAFTEASKIKELAGEGAAAQEYREAETIIETELVESYQNFNPAFFFNGDAAEQYKKILGDVAVQNVLTGKAPVETIPHTVVRELNLLVDEEKLHSKYIQKNYRAQSLNRLTLECGLKQLLTPAQARYIGGRTIEHLYRMIDPDVYYPDSYWRKDIPEGTAILNSVCPSFAKDFVQFVSTIEGLGSADSTNITEVIGSEGYDVMTFWTLAPYVEDELRRSGLSSHDAMAKVFDWVRDAHTAGYDHSGTYAQGRDNLPHVHSPIGSYRHNYVLGLDERMPSHLLSRCYAKAVVDNMNKLTELE